MKLSSYLSIFLISLFFSACSNSGTDDNGGATPPETINEVDFYLTTSSGSQKLKLQEEVLSFGTSPNRLNPEIVVDPSKEYQQMDGFGFSLTGGSAAVINQLDPGKRNALLQELFGNTASSVSISYLRISIGASDLNEYPFTYNDMPLGQTDPELQHFSLQNDETHLIPVLKEILEINPQLKILGSPWTAPAWMKTNESFVGGSLLKEYYPVYASYFVRYIQAMEDLGIHLDAISVQNEPLHDGNNPSMYMTAADQSEFVGLHLGPAFEAAGLNTKIIIWDHNCDNYQYPLEVLGNSIANPYINGTAFHLYAGNISALSVVHNQYPEKDIYFTEQYTSSTGDFGGDLRWHTENVLIGASRNWSKNVLEWNLASDPEYAPHTEGGCTVCKGALTIDNAGNISRNVSYYIIAHASSFVPAGSVRIESALSGDLIHVAFKTPQNKIVLIILNRGSSGTRFNVNYLGKWFSPALDAGSVCTLVWET